MAIPLPIRVRMVCPGARSSGAHAGRRSFCRVIGTTEGVIGTTEVVRFHVLDFPTLARKRRSLGVEQRRTRGPTRNFVPTEILRPAMQSARSSERQNTRVPRHENHVGRTHPFAPNAKGWGTFCSNIASELRSDLVNHAVAAGATVKSCTVDVARTVGGQASGWIESVVCAGKAVDHGVVAVGV